MSPTMPGEMGMGEGLLCTFLEREMESTLVWKEELLVGAMFCCCWFFLFVVLFLFCFRLSIGKEIWQSIKDYLSVLQHSWNYVLSHVISLNSRRRRRRRKWRRKQSKWGRSRRRKGKGERNWNWLGTVTWPMNPSARDETRICIRSDTLKSLLCHLALT